MLILASASPRRRALLRYITPDFEVRPTDCDEHVSARRPSRYVQTLARRKALACPAAPGDVVIAADTVVCAPDGRILNKPRSPDEARAMLGLLSGCTHRVYTGVAVRHPGGLRVFCEKTTVAFRTLSPSFIEDYIASGEPFDKAGGYGIQGRGALMVRYLHGDFFNVMGLPLGALYEVLSDGDLL